MGSRYNTLNKFMGAYLHPPSRQVFGLILFGSAHFFRHFGSGYLVIQETRVLKTFGQLKIGDKALNGFNFALIKF